MINLVDGRGINVSTLYIIGNGFDLSHGLKTSYAAFSLWVANTHNEIFEKIERMINEYNELVIIDEDKLTWFDFEKSLHELIQSPVFEDFVDESTALLMDYGSEDWSDSGHHDFQYEVYEYIVPLRDLKLLFQEWINTEILPTIKNINPKFEFSIDPLFFTFNYTDVLETLYKQSEDNIYHIHGDYKNIIVGHSANLKNFIGDPFDQDGDIRVTEAASIISEVHDSLNKKVQSQMEKFKRSAFFDKLGTVKEVNVIGHSYNEYDLPYFCLLKENCNCDIHWILNYRTDKDLKNLKTMVKKLKIFDYEWRQI